LDHLGLAAHADALASLVAPSVRLLPQPSSDNDAIGRSRLGGTPDLAPAA
jgi:hypothetical protein